MTDTHTIEALEAAARKALTTAGYASPNRTALIKVLVQVQKLKDTQQ